MSEFHVLALTVQMMFCSINRLKWPRTSRPGFPAVFALGLMLISSGCGTGPQAEFKLRDSTEDLIKEARKAVEKTLKEGFGTPNALVAWERFPVAYGGIRGTVASFDPSSSLITATFEGDSKKIEKGDPVIWISGANSDGKLSDATVTSINTESNQLGLANTSQIPFVGDRFVVGFGEDLQFGRVVYMKNCMHCHGVTGDGNGPTAKFLNPLPRDYRNGQFKFTSTKASEKATRDDLHRIVQNGIPGTYMPSFLLLGDRETTAVIEYVRWLAIRGEFEKRLVADLTDDYSQASIKDAKAKADAAFAEKKKNKEEAERPPSEYTALKEAGAAFKKFESDKEYEGAVDETANLLADAWTRAEDPENVVVPTSQRVEDTPESRERGRRLFISDTTKCYTCHGPTGRGDGGATEDFWPKPGSNEKYKERGLHDEWGHVLKPRNLTLGQYRGGRRPIDLFRRMRAGIKGTPMPAFGDTVLKEPQLWDLVNYVMSLPYQAKPAPSVKHTTEDVAKIEEKPAQ